MQSGIHYQRASLYRPKKNNTPRFPARDSKLGRILNVQTRATIRATTSNLDSGIRILRPVPTRVRIATPAIPALDYCADENEYCAANDNLLQFSPSFPYLSTPYTPSPPPSQHRPAACFLLSPRFAQIHRHPPPLPLSIPLQQGGRGFNQHHLVLEIFQLSALGTVRFAKQLPPVKEREREKGKETRQLARDP